MKKFATVVVKAEEAPRAKSRGRGEGSKDQDQQVGCLPRF